MSLHFATRIGRPLASKTRSGPRWRSRELQGGGFSIGNLVFLLRHRNGLVLLVLRGALQHGHRARVVARATIRCRRIVAIELATCRSGRTGGTSGSIILGNARRRELFGGIAGS